MSEAPARLVAPHGVPRPLALTFGALGLLSVIATVVVLEVYDPGLIVDSDTFSVYTGLLGAAACVAAAAANRGAMRVSWAMFASFMALYAAGDALWLAFGGAEGNPPVLSVADALYTVAFVPIVIGMGAYPVVAYGGRAWRVVLLDGLVITAAVMLLVHVLVLHPIFVEGDGLLEKVMLAIYPVTDALIAAYVVLLLLRSTGPRRCDVMLIGVTWAIYTAADSGYAVLRLDDENSLGTVVDVGYTVAPLVLAAAAAVAVTLPTPRRTLRRHLPGTVPPILADLMALSSMAVAAALRSQDDVTVVLGIVTLAAVAGRRVAQRTERERLRGELQDRIDERTRELDALTQDYERLDAMKYEFVTAVSHELRTPLAAIRGSLEMLYDGDAGELPRSTMPVLAIAARGSERLSRLVDDIIDLERLESGSFGFSPATSPVAPLIEDATQSLRLLACDQGVEIRTLGAEGLAWCDPDRVVQVLVNLIGNALKYSPAGGAITVEATEQDHEITISVTDQGRGIPAGDLESVFDRFHQVDMDDARQQGGAGLGLTICRHIVERHNGRIWAESRAGAGATFRFTLPSAAPR